MADVVLILGAGCSKHAGAPLMGNFLDVASDLYKSDAVTDRRHEFETVFQVLSDLQLVHSKSELDLVNIESVFSAAEMARTIQRLVDRDPAQIADALVALRWLIVRTLEESMQFALGEHGEVQASGEYEHCANAINHLLRERRPHLSVAVITFNYDLALELALQQAGIEYSHGFEPRSDPKTVTVHKLHGSLNWGVDRNAKRIHAWKLSEALGLQGIVAHRHNEREGRGKGVMLVGSNLGRLKIHGAEIDPTPALVPPTWNKGAVLEDIGRVWQSAAAELAGAEYIHVYGYSMPATDQFFRYLFALGTAGRSRLRQFVVCNPDKTVAERFQSILGPGARARFSYVENGEFAMADGLIKQI